MTYWNALTTLRYIDLRALCKVRGIRWYSYLNKKELAYRLFGDDPILKRALCCVNQMRRHKIKEPMDPNQWA